MKKVIEYAQTPFYLFWYNKRKISAIIKRSKIRRIKVYIMLMAILLSSLEPIFAIQNDNLPFGDKDIYYRVDDKSYIIYDNIPQKNTEYYYNQDGKERVAYCIDLGLNGAEYAKDGHYVVDASSKIETTDKVLNDILLNCYPYKSVEELGLNTVDEAIFASQFAIWCYTSKLNLDIMRPTTDEYSRVDSCIRNIYNFGINGVDSSIVIEKNISKQKIEEIDQKEYYTKTIDFTNIKNVKNIDIHTENGVVKIIKNDNKYKVCVPVEYVDNVDNCSIELNMDAVAEENAVLLGISNNAEFQRVAVTLEDTFEYSEKINIDFKSVMSKIIVRKLDEEDNTALEGVVYKVTDEKGNEIGRYTTDKNGEFEIILRNEEKCVVKIVEEKELEYYYKDDKVHVVEVDVGDSKQVTLYNKKKEGTIEIIKKTKQYNELTGIDENSPLSNVSFYIYDENWNLVDDVTTDEFGKAKTVPLKSGKYYIKEYKTQTGYKLLDDVIEVVISFPGENKQVNILNDNFEIPKKLPVTGR